MEKTVAKRHQDLVDYLFSYFFKYFSLYITRKINHNVIFINHNGQIKILI